MSAKNESTVCESEKLGLDQKGLDEVKEICTYSRDELLKVFALAKDHKISKSAKSTKSGKNSTTSTTSSSPLNAPSAAPSSLSKDSSLLDIPDMLPPTLFSAGASDSTEQKDSSGDSSNGNIKDSSSDSNNKDSSSDSNNSHKARKDSPVRVEPETISSDTSSNGYDQSSSDANQCNLPEETWGDPQKVWCKQASWNDLYTYGQALDGNRSFGEYLPGNGLLGNNPLANTPLGINPLGINPLGVMPPMFPFLPDPATLAANQMLQASLNNFQKLAKKTKSKPVTKPQEVCHECNNVLNPEFIFCDQCGTKKKTVHTCVCGNCLVAGANFCDQCGRKQTEDDEATLAGGKGDAKEKAKAVGKDKTKAVSKQTQKPKKSQASLDVTTLMLRNIPKCTQDQLFEHLEKIGFQGMIDFLYLPVDFSNERNFGYAFANFRTPEAANKFRDQFDDVEMGKCFPEDFGCQEVAQPEASDSDSSSPSAVRQRKAKRNFNREEVCKVLPAAVQGWEANMQKLCNSHSVQRVGGPDHWHPLFLDAEGNRVNVRDRYKPVTPACKTALNPQAVEFVPKSLRTEDADFSKSDLDAHPSAQQGSPDDVEKSGEDCPGSTL